MEKCPVMDTGVLPRIIQRRMHALIHEVDGYDLESGRSLTYEVVRTFPLEPHVIDRILRTIAEQQSKTDLLAALQSFVVTREPVWWTKVQTVWIMLGRKVRDWRYEKTDE